MPAVGSLDLADRAYVVVTFIRKAQQSSTTISLTIALGTVAQSQRLKNAGARHMHQQADLGKEQGSCQRDRYPAGSFPINERDKWRDRRT